MDSKPAPPVIPYLFPLFAGALVLGVIIYGVFQAFSGSGGRAVPMTGPGSIVTILQRDLATRTPATLTQQGSSITLRAGGQAYTSTFDSRLDILRFLRSAGIDTRSRRFRTDVTIQYASAGQTVNVAATLLSLVPLLLFLLLLVFVRRRRGRTGQ